MPERHRTIAVPVSSCLDAPLCLGPCMCPINTFPPTVQPLAASACAAHPARHVDVGVVCPHHVHWTTLGQVVPYSVGPHLQAALPPISHR
jgi:hypothetical protein